MTRFTVAHVALALTAGVAGCSAQAPVPVFKEPRHHVVYENKLVRVLDVRVPPGDTTLYHVHAERYVGVVINGANGWEQFLGRDATPNKTVTASILDNSNQTLPYTHRVGNIDTVAFHYVVGQQLARSGIDAFRLPEKANMHFERETPLAYVYRITLAPGEVMASHQHAQPGLTVQISAGTMQAVGTAPAAESKEKGAGAWWWRNSGHDHSLVNTGPTTVYLLEVDWK